MPEQRVPGETDSPVAVGQELHPDVAPDEVLQAIVRPRSDDSRRYIAYSTVADAETVERRWVSVDLDAVVSRELWR